MKNVLFITGGKGEEREVTLRSAVFLKSKLSPESFNIFHIEIAEDGSWNLDGSPCVLGFKGLLQTKSGEVQIDYAIGYIHGAPGETGQIIGMFETLEIPFLGPSSESSILCFNKISTKLWLEKVEVPVTPYAVIIDQCEEQVLKAKTFLKEHKDIFLKASNQGSSIGCYHVQNDEELEKGLSNAFKLSPYVLLEKTIKGRELEVSAYEYQGRLYISYPGEVTPPEGGFYDYHEKYHSESQSKLSIKAQNLDESDVTRIKELSTRAFRGLKIKDLSRIDFFLCKTGEIYLNEINTFPGLTEISMFPKMMESEGLAFEEFLKDRIK